MTALKKNSRKIDVVVCMMLFLHVFFPAHGPAHLFELLDAGEPSKAEYFSLHPVSESDLDSSGHHQHDTCSCELDQPSILTPPLFPAYAPAAARLTSQVSGGLLPGSPIPIFIPPEKHA